MTTRERTPLARPWTHAGPREPDGMTERVEVEQPAWHALIFLILLALVLFGAALLFGPHYPGHP